MKQSVYLSESEHARWKALGASLGDVVRAGLAVLESGRTPAEIHIVIGEGGGGRDGSLLDRAGLHIDYVSFDEEDAYRYSTMGDMEVHHWTVGNACGDASEEVPVSLTAPVTEVTEAAPAGAGTIAAVARLTCRTCGEPVRPLRPDDGLDPRDFDWTHEDGNPICDGPPTAMP